MARIKTYELDDPISDNDIIIGSNGDTPNIGETKNFTIGTLKEHLENTLQLTPTPGPQGPEGPRGYTGPRGLPGTNGQNGLQGPQGLRGDKGEKGDKGDKGDIGETGPAVVVNPDGITVIKGDKGDTGEMGPQGIQGLVGPEGPQGIQGVQGIKGDKGDTGDVGPMAIVNPDGITIVKGDKGDPGDPGQDGAQGPAGAIGATGPQGPQGLQGLQGIQGLKGDKGDKGDTGNTGAQGIRGLQGIAGATGATGAQGPKGDTGNTGPQGPIGLTGPAGPQGIPGVGVGDVLQKEITGDYTITDADKGYRLFFNSPNPITVTIDELTTPNFESMFYNIGTGTVTFNSGTASVDYPNNDTLTTDSMGWLIKFMNNNVYKLKAGAVDGTTSGSGSIGGGGGTPGYFQLDTNIIANINNSVGWGFYNDDFIETIPGYTQASRSAQRTSLYGSVDAQYLLCASGDSVYSSYSQNGGASWTNIGSLSYYRNYGVVSDNGRVMLLWYNNSISTGKQLPLISNAYGSNFGTMPTLPFAPSVNAFADFCNVVKMSCDGEKIVAIANRISDSIPKAFISNDRGATFSPLTTLRANAVNNLGVVRDMFISNDALTYGFISVNPGVLSEVTRDGGVTWSTITMPSGATFEEESIYSNNCKYVYIRSDYSLYRSENYGLTFQEVTLPFFEGVLNSYSCSSAGEFVIVKGSYAISWVSKDFGQTFVKMNIPNLSNIQIL